MLVGPQHVLFNCSDERLGHSAAVGDDPAGLWMFVVDKRDDARQVRNTLAAASETA